LKGRRSNPLKIANIHQNKKYRGKERCNYDPFSKPPRFETMGQYVTSHLKFQLGEKKKGLFSKQAKKKVPFFF